MPSEPWFSISGEEILQALRDVAGGESPETAYAKIKAGSDRDGEIDRLQGFERYHDERMMYPSEFAEKWGDDGTPPGWDPLA
jgi:hypothetical protein